MKLNIQVMTGDTQRRTPAERMALAKKLRNTSMGKRKKRRAFRRKPPTRPSSATDGGGGSSVGTGGAMSPDNRSAGGSICESLYSGLEGGFPLFHNERNIKIRLL